MGWRQFDRGRRTKERVPDRECVFCVRLSRPWRGLQSRKRRRGRGSTSAETGSIGQWQYVARMFSYHDFGCAYHLLPRIIRAISGATSRRQSPLICNAAVEHIRGLAGSSGTGLCGLVVDPSKGGPARINRFASIHLSALWTRRTNLGCGTGGEAQERGDSHYVKDRRVRWAGAGRNSPAKGQVQHASRASEGAHRPG